MLTDFLAAAPSDAQAICDSAGAHWKKWPCATLKKIEPVKLASLWAIVVPGVESKKMCSQDVMLCEAASGEAWVFSLPPDFVRVLARIDERTQEKIAVRWAATDELIADGFSPSSASEAVGSMAKIAREALASEKDLLLWMCL